VLIGEEQTATLQHCSLGWEKEGFQ